MNFEETLIKANNFRMVSFLILFLSRLILRSGHNFEIHTIFSVVQIAATLALEGNNKKYPRI